MSRRIALFVCAVTIALLVGVAPRPAAADGLFAPTINSLVPSQVIPGVTGQVVKILGTDFQSTAAVTLTPDTGITFTTEYISASEVRITAAVAGNAPTTPRDVTVTQGLFGGSDTCEACLTVGPEITSVTGPLANTGVTGTFNITGRAFVVGSQVRITRSGYGFNAAETDSITASNVLVNNPTSITATVSTLNRAPGFWNVIVQKDTSSATFGNGATTGLQISGNAPAISSIKRVPDNIPSRIEPNTSNVQFAFVGKNFANGMTASVSGSGVTQSAVTNVADATHATVTLSAASSAPVGVRGLTLRNSDGQPSSAAAFGVGVNAPTEFDPTVTSVSSGNSNPAIVGQGASQLALTVVGANFGTTPDVTVSGTGVTVNNIRRDSSTKLTVAVTTAIDAPTGARSLTVTNGTNPNPGTLANALTVSSGFAVTGLTPPGRYQGYTGTVVVNGAGFPVTAPTVTFSPDTGITVTGPPTRDSAARITVPISVASTDVAAPPTARDVIVNGGAPCVGCFKVGKVPTVLSIAPTSANGGGQVAISHITGTDFADNPTVTLERTDQPSISMIDVVRNSATDISGTFDLTDAGPGKWTVRVTNVDGGSAAKTDAFTVVRGAPSVTGADPEFVTQASAPTVVHVVGTEFAPGMTVTMPNSDGVSITKVERKSNTGADITVTTTDIAGLGSRDIKVTNSDGQFAVCESCFVVTQGNQKQFFGNAFAAYDNFGGGAFIAAGRLGGSGAATDVVTGANAGGGPHVRAFVISPTAGTAGTIASFFAYNEAFPGGVRVALGDLDGDGTDEIITGAGPGGGPHVKVFHVGADGSLTQPFGGGFFAYDAAFAGGVWVGAGDVNGDGKDDIITGAGSGGGPHVRAFSVAAGGVFQEIASFFAYNEAFAGGVTVAAGDMVAEADGPVIAEIATTPSVAGGPHVRVFSKAGAVLREFFAFQTQDDNGYRVAVGDFDFDTIDDLAISRGSTKGIFVGHVIDSAPFFEPLTLPNPEPFGVGANVAAGDVDDDGDADLAVVPDHASPATVRLMRPLSHTT
ncbi:MAG: hypothetical protein QOF21_2073 [Actinomycetota bacterium]|jgi:hypothetical protein